jgi:uncharacterized protein (UPF0332 family)
MTYEDLLHKGSIKQIKASSTQVLSRLALAKRDIHAAQSMMTIDRDWAFSMAYNAVLQATRALMFAKGFRPAAGEGQHKAAVEFAEIALGKKFQDEIYIFDKMRSKRHRVIYDVIGLVSEEEAAHAHDFATRFVNEVEKILKHVLKNIENTEKTSG